MDSSQSPSELLTSAQAIPEPYTFSKKDLQNRESMILIEHVFDEIQTTLDGLKDLIRQVDKAMTLCKDEETANALKTYQAEAANIISMVTNFENDIYSVDLDNSQVSENARNNTQTYIFFMLPEYEIKVIQAAINKTAEINSRFYELRANAFQCLRAANLIEESQNI